MPIGGVRAGYLSGVKDAIPDSEIDFFNDGNISEYGGSTSSFTVDQTSPVFEGSHSLKFDSTGISISSTSGLPNYPDQGDTFEYRLNVASQTTDNGTNYKLLWATQSENTFPDSYRVEFANKFQDFVIQKRDGGSNINLVSDTGLNIPTGEWLRIEIVWETDNSIQATLEEADGTQVSQLSTSDSTFTSAGGVGYSTFDDDDIDVAIDTVGII
jgi:hypothetical protein